MDCSTSRSDDHCLDIYTHTKIYMHTLVQSTININAIAFSETENAISWLCQEIASQLSRGEQP